MVQTIESGFSSSKVVKKNDRDRRYKINDNNMMNIVL